MFECYEEFEAFICERIGTLRSQKGVSARDMSLTLGQGAGYINNIENKHNTPSMKGFFYICEFFQIAPKEFFDHGLTAPGLFKDLMEECKKLDEKSMQGLLEFIKAKNKPGEGADV